MERKLNMRPDPPDFRDRIYNPTLRALEHTHNAEPFRSAAWEGRVMDQGDTQACTGFALAGMVEALLAHQRGARSRTAPPAPPVSPFMLYYMARRYDEIPGDDANGGSTARAAMKGWNKHGACALDLWSAITLDACSANPRWVGDAFHRPLGAYYRVDHSSIPDLHAAINETGVVYVTASIHEGWRTPAADGAIPFEYGSLLLGGHAFLLVGYDQDGFWIQNSWGPTWGRKGFARLSYGDWRANGMDAWIGQLGVHITDHGDSLIHGLQSAPQADAAVVAQTTTPVWTMLSSDPNVSAQQLNKYVLKTGNNGTLDSSGQFATQPEDLQGLVTTMLSNALAAWGLDKTGPIDVALYAHGGLVDVNAAAETARCWIPALFANRIFPIFFMWETGVFDTLRDIVNDRFRGVPEAAGAGFWDNLVNHTLDWLDDRIEVVASAPGTAMWDQMKQNAQFATANPQSGLHQLYQQVTQVDPAIRQRIRLHLIGHSAGSIYHGYLLPALVQAGLNVAGVYFMAPACRVELFQQNVAPLVKAGTVGRYAQFYMSDQDEQDDSCDLIGIPIYHKSLLYMVSDAFEHQRGMPILGMAKYVDALNLRAEVAGGQADWFVSTTVHDHGDFDNDETTRRQLISLILGHDPAVPVGCRGFDTGPAAARSMAMAIQTA